MNEWISVKERLPDDNIEVLVCYANDIIQAYKSGGKWKGSRNVTDCMNDGFVADRTICEIGNHFDFVTHWMPLPNPPKTDEA